MQNELTAERIAAAIRVVETEQKCVMRNADGYCDRQCEKCDLLMLVAEILGGYDTALAALRAEQERSKGCEWCKTELRFECYLIDDNGYTASIENNVVQTTIADYCPMCGRRLTEGEESNED